MTRQVLCKDIIALAQKTSSKVISLFLNATYNSLTVKTVKCNISNYPSKKRIVNCTPGCPIKIKLIILSKYPHEFYNIPVNMNYITPSEQNIATP
jgi:hypothetical protein